MAMAMGPQTAMPAGTGVEGRTRAAELRVLIVTDQYEPMVGGVPTVTRELARGLAERGHAVAVLAPSASQHGRSADRGPGGAADRGPPRLGAAGPGTRASGSASSAGRPRPS